MEQYLVSFPGLGLTFNINRVAFSIGGLHIYWYGLLIATGLLLAVIFGMRHAVEFGIDSDRLLDVICIGTVMSIVCARIYYVAMSPYSYATVWDMFKIRDGGIAIYGALIGAFVFGGLACKWRKIPVFATFDLVAMGFLIGQGLGRWGNFVNQEAFGYNTTLPWGMLSEKTTAYLETSVVTLPAGITIDPTLPVHPTFLYESIWCFAGFAMLYFYYKKRRFNGDVALLYSIWYGVGRFWIEGLRTDSLLLVPSLGLRASQVVAAAAVAAALVLEIICRKRCKAKPLMITPPLTSESLKKIAAFGKAHNGVTGVAITPVPADAGRAAFIKATAQANANIDETLKNLGETMKQNEEQDKASENTAKGPETESTKTDKPAQ